MSANLVENPIVTPEFIDEFARLHDFISPYLDQYESMKKLLVAEVSKQEGKNPASLVGKNFAIDYSAPTVKSVLAKTEEELFKLAGIEAFSVSVTKAKSVLSEENFKSYFKEKVESRRFKRVRNNQLRLV
jgi:hypothetical protein